MKETLYIPYRENLPSAVEINGHRLVIVGHSAEEFFDFNELFEVKELREFSVEDSTKESLLTTLAIEANGGIVLNPPGLDVVTLIESLEKELPWLQ